MSKSFHRPHFHIEAVTGFRIRQTMISDHLDDSIDGDSISTPLLKATLENVKAEFEESTWQAFWLTTVENQKPSLVAERTGLSLVSVYQAKSRVLKRLRNAQAQWPR